MADRPVTVGEDTLHPAITHAATRRVLTREGLPAEHGLTRFAPVAEARLVTVPHLVAAEADPTDLDPYIAELVVIGHLAVREEETQEVVLDGATGRVFSLYLWDKSPGNAELYPLAPSLATLTDFLTAVDDFEARRGPFRHLAGRTGPEAVAEASELLLSVFAGADWGSGDWGPVGDRAGWGHPVPVFWRIAALIRPLALIAGPGDGLRLDLPRQVLEEAFGADRIVRVAPEELPGELVHEPTRRFLTEVGLPRDGLMFGLDGEEDDLLRPLPEVDARYRAMPELRHLFRDPESADHLPADADHLLSIGGLIHDFDVLLDGRTGKVLYGQLGDSAVTPVNADVSTLAFTVWTHHREQVLNEEHDFTQDFYHELADTMIGVLASLDPVACLPPEGPDDFRYWPEVFHDEAGGVL
ncbi:SUKH-4 family immunity protein [Streptomyces megasporus]|uniref:SUKH-4 family immunity protein n=1 Tax=Streptomyces megasporus TaxID=44060 RepID=UPI0004E2769B|nr:SUKH-4 family immunity protein [Streptomyces megasporus]